VEPATFERQLEIVRRRFPVISLPALVDSLPPASYPDGAVAVSFDDGYVDNLSTAYPIASALDVPITVFVAARPILQGGLYWWDDLACRLLEPSGPAAPPDGDAKPRSPVPSPDGLKTYGQEHTRLKKLPGADRERAMAAIGGSSLLPDPASIYGRPMIIDELLVLDRSPGVTIGAHTLTHPSLSALPEPEQERELVGAKSELERMLGHEIAFLAYPFGKKPDVSRGTARLAKHAGYRAAFMSRPGAIEPHTDLYTLPRLTLHEWPDEVFLARLEGILGRSGA
jgi:peptidoglycan/xylan/chitin deacetylase (PgdA/CDA1 family)